MKDYLEHVKLYLKEKFNIKADILPYQGGTAVPKKYNVVIFVQKINPGLLRQLNGEPAPAQHNRHANIHPPIVNRPGRVQRKMVPQFATSPPQPSTQATKMPKIYLLNTEQATSDRYLRVVINDVQRYKVPVIDYSLENISILRTKLPNTKFIHLPFPIRYNPTLPKKNGIVSLLSSAHRRKIGKNVGSQIVNFMGKWGEQRDALIRNSKILLNIHYKPIEYNIFESIRCYHALEMGTIVVSEPSYDHSKILLGDLIVFCSGDQMRAKVKEILANYEQYYNHIFSPENLAVVEKQFEKVYQAAIEEIMG